jgi:drug/metabolite transporter (DMT)-like permease
MLLDRRYSGYALAAVGASLFSTKAIFIKLAYEEQLDAALMLAYRMIFALPVFVAIGALTYARKRARGEPGPGKRAVGLAMLTGFVGYYLASQFDFAGLLYISAQLERLVLFTYPLFVMFLGAALYGEPVTRAGLAAAAVTYTGLATVFALDLPEGGRSTVIGTLLVLGAAVTFALHQIMAKRFMPPLGSALFTAISLTTAGVLCIVHQGVVGGGDFSATPRFLWLSLGCAVVATVAPSFLINAGIARTSPQAVSMISTVSPIVTIALAVAILGEPFTAADAIGSSLVLAGVGLFTWGDARRNYFLDRPPHLRTANGARPAKGHL